MIANICAFLLCCFAITSNIKTTESVNTKICPLRFLNPFYTEFYVRTIEKCKTFNKHQIGIRSAFRKCLTDSREDIYQNYNLKLKSQFQFEKKVTDIKCSFCLIAKSYISHLKELVEKLNSGETFINNEHVLKRLKREANIIVDLILFGNLGTGKWLWSYFLKIIAISKYDDNKAFIHENPFEDDQLRTGVSEFLENCMTKKYLPTTAMESDFVSKNMKIYLKMFHHLRVSMLRFSSYLPEPINNTTIEFLYLKSFWDGDRQFLFGEITGAIVDWSTAKLRLEVEVISTKEFVHNRTWIYKPFGRHVHQQLLINIIDARIYCYLSVILHVYEISFPHLNEQSRIIKKRCINEVIMAALKFTAFKDEFLVSILSEIKLSSENNADDIINILATVTKKANEILNNLNGASTSGIDRLSINVNEDPQLISILWYIRKFEDYLHHLTNFLPLEYKVLLNFMGAVKIPTAQFAKF